MHMNKQGTQFVVVILWLYERHRYSQSRELVTCQWTQLFSTRNPDDSPKACVCSPYILPSPQRAGEITVTSLYDITITCSTLFA